MIDKVIAAAVVQGRANRPNKNTVNGEVWCSEDGLVLALFDTLKRLVDRNPGVSVYSYVN